MGALTGEPVKAPNCLLTVEIIKVILDHAFVRVSRTTE